MLDIDVIRGTRVDEIINKANDIRLAVKGRDDSDVRDAVAELCGLITRLAARIEMVQEMVYDLDEQEC